jgi:hypothetical protein
MEKVFNNNAFYLVFVLFILYFISFVCSVIACITSIANKRKALEVLRINMIIKLIHIPAYIMIFVVGLFCMITIFTFGITIALIILDGLTIVLSGLIGLGGVTKSLKENKISKIAAAIHGILQFVFCADIISSVIIYLKVKKTENVFKYNQRSR